MSKRSCTKHVGHAVKSSRQTACLTMRTERSDKHTLVAVVIRHANPIPEDGTPHLEARRGRRPQPKLSDPICARWPMYAPTRVDLPTPGGPVKSDDRGRPVERSRFAGKVHLRRSHRPSIKLMGNARSTDGREPVFHPAVTSRSEFWWVIHELMLQI